MSETRVGGGPVDERRRSNPRAHRFQAVESTSGAEQPSPFAGRRTVGVLAPSLRGRGSPERGRSRRFKSSARARSSRCRKSGRALQLRSGSAAMTGGARREKRRGLHHAQRRPPSLPRHRNRRTRQKRASAACSASFARPFDPCVRPWPFSQERRGRSSNRSATHGSHPSQLPSGSSFGRKLEARGKPKAGNLSWGRGSTARGRARVSKKCSCRSCKAVRGSSGRLALSAGRRRSLALVSFVFSARCRKAGGTKGCGCGRGETARGHGPQAHTCSSGIVTAGPRMVVLAGIHGRGTRSRGLASRRGTLRWKASWLALKSVSVTGGRWMQAWPS